MNRVVGGAAVVLGFAFMVGCASARVSRLPLLAATDVSSGAPLPAADVEIRDGKAAVVHGTAVPFDGVAEGLSWPALARAARGNGGSGARSITIAVGREVPVSVVLRAVWTLRDADLHLRTADAAGVERTLDLPPKPAAPPGTGCHLAVFVAPNGDLRVAAPGGPRSFPGPDAAATLAHALENERGRCPLRYVAFGAEASDSPWGAVFDVARAVDRDKSAGDARYVLGEPIHGGATH